MTQFMRIKTDHHIGSDSPADQLIGMPAACALMLYQELSMIMDSSKTSDMKTLETGLWKQLKEWQFSKWDLTSQWYVAEVIQP
jgi:hypothetical protein